MRRHRFRSLMKKVSLIIAPAIAAQCLCTDDKGLDPSFLDPPPNNPADTVIDTTLLYMSDLHYRGAFRVPNTGFGQSEQQAAGYAYGGTALAFNPSKRSLLLVGHDWYQYTGEIGIPDPVIGAGISGLNRAGLLQGLTDITEGRMNNVGAGGAEVSGCKIGGFLAVKDKLLGTSYAYYDAAGNARLSHFFSGLEFSVQGDVGGLYSVGSKNAGFVAGYMAHIPPEWQARFKADALTGQACLPIISRTSYGPSVTSFKLGDIGRLEPAPGTLLVGYPAEHPTLGTWGNSTVSNPQFNMATGVSGVVFPKKTGSVLFFGSTGVGIPLYGEGTTDSSLHGKPVPGTNGQVSYAYDPASGAKGCHAYPYVYYVWAYRALDLEKVSNGEKNPWDVLPYKTWKFELPFAPANGGRGLGGVAYDAEKGTLYLSQLRADGDGPLIHVFGIGR